MPNATIPKISRWRSSHGGGGDDGGGAGDRTTTTTTTTTVDTLFRQPHSPTFLPCCTVRLLFVLWDSFVYLTTEILSFFLTSYISSFSNQFNLVLYIILYQPWKRRILDKYFFKRVIGLIWKNAHVQYASLRDATISSWNWCPALQQVLSSPLVPAVTEMLRDECVKEKDR